MLKLHSRRVTCVEFHPSHNSLVLSGDKKGQVAVWNLDKVGVKFLGGGWEGARGALHL